MGIGLQLFVLSKEFVILSEAEDLPSVEPRRAQVLPSRVLSFNQRDFLSPQPSFNRLFPGNGIVYILGRLIVNETMNSVIPSEAGVDIVLMLPGAPVEVVGDASLKHSRFAGEDVHVEMAHRKAVLRFAQHDKNEEVLAVQRITANLCGFQTMQSGSRRSGWKGRKAGPSLRSG